jgi:predicted ester cyclase
MAQTIKQNGVTIMSSPENTSCSIIFGNLTGRNIKGEEYRKYLKMMFHDFPNLTYGEIELWEDGEQKLKWKINK